MKYEVVNMKWKIGCHKMQLINSNNHNNNTMNTDRWTNAQITKKKKKKKNWGIIIINSKQNKVKKNCYERQ